MEIHFSFWRNCFRRITLCTRDCVIFTFTSKKPFIRATKILHCTLTTIDIFALRKKLYRRGYTWKRFDRTAYLTANYSCISPNCSLVPLPSLQPPALSNVQLFNGPPRPKTPGKIIQISSLRFPSNPSERGGSTRVDAQHTGCPGDSRANWRLPKRARL